MAAYVTAAAGLWSDAATWTTAIPSGGPGLNVADNDTVTINHDVTHDRAGITWLGTGVASNTAIQVNGGGALRASRSISGTLRCWGSVIVAPLGTIDFGTIASPIPAAVNALLQFRSNFPKFGLTCQNNSESYFVGTSTRTRKTRLIAQLNGGTSSMRVADATGWQVGDYVVLAASAGAFNGPHISTISSVTFNGVGDWTVVISTAANATYSQRKPVANLFTNVAVHAVDANSPYNVDLAINGAGGVAVHEGIILTNDAAPVRANTRVMRSMRVGCGGLGGTPQMSIDNRVPGSTAWADLTDWVVTSRGGAYLGLAGQQGRFNVNGAVFEYTDLISIAYLFQLNAVTADINDFLVTYGALSNGNGSYIGLSFRNGHWGGTFLFSQGSVISDCLFENVEFGYAGNYFVNQGGGTPMVFRRCLFGIAFSEDPVRGYMETVGGGTNGFMPTIQATTAGIFTFTDCRFSSGYNLDTFYGVGGGGGISLAVSPNTRVIIANKDENPTQQIIYTPDGSFRLDTTTFRSAPYSLRWTPNTRNRPQSLTFNVIAPNNAQVPVSGFVRRDATYRSAGGTVVATLSGPGITPVSYTSSGAADVWEQFAFNVIQSTGAPAVLTLTLTFTGTTGNAYADDIVAPSSQAVSTGEFTYWASGQPLNAILANFAPAADVWSIPIANLTTPASIGEALANVESGNSIQQALRLLLAIALGNVSGGPNAPVFKSLDGTKDRVVGTATPTGNRTRTSIDPS